MTLIVLRYLHLSAPRKHGKNFHILKKVALPCMCTKLMTLVVLPSILFQNRKSSDLVKTYISIAIINFKNMSQHVDIQIKN